MKPISFSRAAGPLKLGKTIELPEFGRVKVVQIWWSRRTFWFCTREEWENGSWWKACEDPYRARRFEVE